MTTSSIAIALSRLRKALILLHFLAQSDQDCLKVVLLLPVLEKREFGGVNVSVGLVDGGNVDLGGEFDCWRLVWVFHAAYNVEEVDSAVEVRVGGADDRAVPVEEVSVVAVSQSVRTGLVAEALFPTLEFLEQSESSGHAALHVFALLN